MAWTITPVATVAGPQMRAYTVTTDDDANDDTVTVESGVTAGYTGVRDFGGAAVQPNFILIQDMTGSATGRIWSAYANAGALATKVDISRIKAKGSVTARLYVGYLHTIIKGSAT